MTSAAPTRLAGWLESAWLARYLDRELEGEELEWFEAYLVDKPDLLEMVEVDNRLRDVLEANSSEMTSRNTEFQPADSARGHSSAAGSARRPALFLSRVRGAAAVAAFCAGVFAGWLGGHRFASRAALPELIASPTRITYDVQRSGGPETPIVDTAAEGAAFVLIEVPVPDDATNIRVRVKDGDSHALRPGADGFVSFLVAETVISARDPLVLSYESAGRTSTRELAKHEPGRAPQ